MDSCITVKQKYLSWARMALQSVVTLNERGFLSILVMDGSLHIAYWAEREEPK